ncbi:Txe/YoeB family addiction module toxin [Pseudoduganella sp. GCM10020061]|uniref:Txe/YoeB family addiction module toxin n=1 Tax=Pseudoduganella sp. GCM10020061 TaxID=3317345 RepID=UPI003672F86B
MRLCFVSSAWQDCLYWQQHDRKMLERINALVKETMREPFAGPGKPEALRHALAGCWSRRLDREHRMVYRVENDTLTILQLRFHYE